jgi:Secretion system C-terminal sorting domain/Kelch motif
MITIKNYMYMKNIGIAIFILTTNILFAQEGVWQIIDIMTNPVAGGNAVYQNGNIFISGGYSKETQGNVDWVQRYNIDQKSSEIIANLKNPRYGHVSSIVNESIYFVGGIADSTELNNSMEEFNISDTNKTNIINFNSNFNRIFSTGVTYNNNFYLIGGNSYSDLDTNNLSYIVEYNVSMDSVTYEMSVADSILEFPEQQMSAIDGNYIYIFGGVSNGVLQTIQRFNMLTDTLDTLEIKLLEPRAGGVAVMNEFTNQIYIIGGFNEGNSALKSVEILSIYGNNYYINSGPELAEARTNLMAVSTIYQGIFIFGGYNENGEVINSIEQMESSAVSNNEDSYEIVSFSLEQNYPNPFNPSTTIKYSIPHVDSKKSLALQNVSLKIYNILGSEVAEIVKGGYAAGQYEINFDASELTSGIYFYTLRVGSFVQTKKMTVLK